MLVGLVFTFAYIVYFKFVAPGDNDAAHWWLGISPEGIGAVGAALNFATAAAVSRFTPPVPAQVRDLVQNIRVPRGSGRPREH
jgi:cation/acetate symporter